MNINQSDINKKQIDIINQQYTEKIREAAKRILLEKKADVVIGFKNGTEPMKTEPCLITKASDVDKLIWNEHCRLNLANYVKGRKDKVAVVAKGCDSRNLVNHIIEKQIKRENLYIIGVPCNGMVDKFVNVKESKVGVESETMQKNLDVFLIDRDMLQDNCKTCISRNPVIFDEMIAEPVKERVWTKEEKLKERFESVNKIEAMAESDRWSFFNDMLSSCTRCYACRNACSLCYCPTCFVDESRPQWVGKGVDPVDVRTYHFLRAFHCAGRCTDCGACEAACPMNIKVRLFTKKLDKECFESFGWEAGMSLDERPPLDVYKVNDSENFIR
ncbi:MAG: 4Fe-4S ferredoxin [Desulfamplus sp.]|nr:4Fe-4S ferredoxin [Desulfamplus sp.]